MNQILATSMPVNEKHNKVKKIRNSQPIDVKNIIKVFAILLIIFGTFMVGTGAHAIYKNQNEVEGKILDPNITACREKRDLMRQYIETNAYLDFTQGLDIRLINDDDIADINKMKIKRLHFAWDNPNDDLYEKFKRFSEGYKRKHRSYKTVYVLTNYNSTMEQNLERIYKLKELQYDPYVMVYDKPHAPREIRLLQRWCNNKYILQSCPRFEDFDPKKA